MESKAVFSLPKWPVCHLNGNFSELEKAPSNSVFYKIGATLSFSLNVLRGDFSRIAPWEASR